MSERDDFPIESMTGGLGFPEGPLALADGSILVCDVHGGLVRRVVDGHAETLADLGGAPNGLALGPEGWVYVANNGGNMRWDRQGDLLLAKGYHFDGDARIERVHVDTGRVERVLDRVGGQRLEAIDDLVFDPRGGFWFTDLGRDGPRSRTYGGMYWSSVDGRDSRKVVYPLANGANGIALSPDASTLYVTEYGAGRLWAWAVQDPGRLSRADGHAHGGRLVWQAPDAQLLDSLAITAAGNLVVAMQPRGAFCVVSPDGELLATVGMPDRFPTNLCFDPLDPTRAYATLSSSGRLASVRWNERGHVPMPGATDRAPALGTGAHAA